MAESVIVTIPAPGGPQQLAVWGPTAERVAALVSEPCASPNLRRSVNGLLVSKRKDWESVSCSDMPSPCTGQRPRGLVSQALCYGVTIWVSPLFLCWEPQCGGVRVVGLWEVVRVRRSHEGGVMRGRDQRSQSAVSGQGKKARLQDRVLTRNPTAMAP